MVEVILLSDPMTKRNMTQRRIAELRSLKDAPTWRKRGESRPDPFLERMVMRQLWQNLRYSFRALRKNPGFSAVAILSLALGIGANTAIFSLINALLLRDLPVPHPERLVERSVVRQDHKIPFSYPMFRELERGQRVFSGLIGWGGGIPNVEVKGTLFQNQVLTVTRNYYSELGVTPSLAG